MGTALDELIELLDLEQLEVNLFRGLSPDENRQRVFGGQVAGQALVAAGRTVEHGHRALAARLLPAARRPARADRLRGRPHPRRQELHDAPGGRDPARQGDLQPAGVVPGARAGPGAPVHDARGARSRVAADVPRAARAAPRPVPARVRRAGSSRDRPIDTRPAELPRWLDPEPRAAAKPSSTSGSAPTASCPTIRCCTTASSRTPPTSRCSTPRCCRTRVVGRRPLHDREPRPRDVVPPAVPRRRVAAVPPAQSRRRRRAAGWPKGSSTATTARSR